MNLGRPLDDWILGRLSYEILFIFPIFLLFCKRVTTNPSGRPLLEFDVSFASLVHIDDFIRLARNINDIPLSTFLITHLAKVTYFGTSLLVCTCWSWAVGAPFSCTPAPERLRDEIEILLWGKFKQRQILRKSI